jgi:XTP/dITP diphosphohydrolase
VRAPVKLFLASSNPGKLAEYRVLAAEFTSALPLDLSLVPSFGILPGFEENAATFAENAAGKALHYSHFQDGLIFADDSGIVVPALNGAPGVHSARYAGPDASDDGRLTKLLREMQGKSGVERNAHFVCAIALFERGKPIAIVTDRVNGTILETPRGAGGFGYDPVFFFPGLQKSFAELTAVEKNQYSHRGKAFRRLLAFLSTVL